MNMYFPTQQSIEKQRNMIGEFGGLNLNSSIQENEFSKMKNMSSNAYPLLSPRERRTVIKSFNLNKKVSSFNFKEALVYSAYDESISDTLHFFINEQEVVFENMSLIEGNKKRTVVGMGAYAVIFPDKKFVNLLDISDSGDIENEFQHDCSDSDTIKITPCTIDGSSFDSSNVSNKEPEEKSNGTVWIDTSGKTTVYKIWDETTSQWQQIATVYLKIQCKNIGSGFEKWDGVSISGIECSEEERIIKQAQALNQKGVILFDVAEDNSYIIIAGLLDKEIILNSGTLKITRTVPDMDFVIESNNRLWGCKYGIDKESGKVVNEIYASKLGDFKNWNCFLGISTDSYAVSVGTDGRFTGAITYGGIPIFFKERYIQKIYGTMPSDFQVVTTNCRGVSKDSPNSLVIVGNTLFYRSPIDFCAYDGALPETISHVLKYEKMTNCISGCHGEKMYVCGETIEGTKRLLVYDMRYGLWHEEDEINIKYFANDGKQLYFVAEENGRDSVFSVDDNYSFYFTDVPVKEKFFEWMATSGEIGYYNIYSKYVQRISIATQLEDFSYFSVKISYDGGPFEKCGEIKNERNKGMSFIPVKPKRCSSFRLMFVGVGKVEIISVTKTYAQGSEVL